MKPPAKGKVSEKTRKSAERAYEKGQQHEPVSPTLSKAREKALKKESTAVASHEALSQQARAAGRRRTPKERSESAKKTVKTKGPIQRSKAAKKAARTRASKKG